MAADRLILNPPPQSPLRCDICFRFVAVKDAVLSHEFGDYGSILSTEVLCPRCAKSGAADREPRLIVCANCGRRLADHCTKHFAPCCPGHCTGTKRGESGWADGR